MEIKTYLVQGLYCKNCRIHVENGIKSLPGIDDVIVDLSNGQVRVTGNKINNEEVKSAVEQSGYIYGGEINITSMNSEHWIS